MSNLYTVTATLLNLRSSTSTADNSNIITRLKNGEVVDVTDASQADWYKVNALNRSPAISGYVASKYLKQVDPSAPVTSPGYLKPVNLPPNNDSRRNNHAAWQYPLGEPAMPFITAADVPGRIDDIYNIVNYLAVDISARYARDVHTYCNIYAYDFCYLSNVFLPRVWWTDKALLDLKNGQTVQALYGVTVNEMTANQLYTWLELWGADFGWTRTYDLDDLQNQVNQGKTGLISGPNVNAEQSGHICCVIPEKGTEVAMRTGGNVVCPVLSQAGAQNLRFYNNNRWWLLSIIKEFGFWYV
ncbi:SH3 domain-containing protein [Mucilaginibacter sp. X4EP1]|uniref:SH3 domain-containing protein n=1 Tax=Mucilaginibacter sp. X4EP1 TaxID=2723092 RepID=UPI002166D91D|nr:SH3 domain-containing protein [Mucilaginibacter sp. X4EP1]MCS3815997.1 hypothetical protein [Mucilaginibacter sp. X4EP1]